MYRLLKKGQKFRWEDEHTKMMKRLKGMLINAPSLRKTLYKEEMRIYVTVDTRLIGIGYAQVKRENLGNNVFVEGK